MIFLRQAVSVALPVNDPASRPVLDTHSGRGTRPRAACAGMGRRLCSQGLGAFAGGSSAMVWSSGIAGGLAEKGDFVLGRRTCGWVGMLVLLALAGCSGQKSEQATETGEAVQSDDDATDRIMLIGLDGAEWDLIHPMVAAGELPNLGRMIDGGAYGNLRSLEPLAKSPAIWTTIATGKSPQEHGILSFIDQVNGQPLTRNIRKVDALWNIYSNLGRTVGLLGWLMSWPAEEVNGFVVSDYVQYEAGSSSRWAGRTYPVDLETEVKPMIVSWPDLPWAFVDRFLDQSTDTLRMSSELESLLRPIKWIAAGDLTFARIGERLYRQQRPDFFAIYFRGMDAMGHLYWNYMIPDSLPAGTLNPTGVAYLKGTERAYYRFTDEIVGRFVELADEKTTIVIVSDHGFRGGTGRGIAQHKLDGIIIMAGNHIAPGEITGADVYDVTPTVLALTGLPAAADMPGDVIWTALDSTIDRQTLSERLSTYETGKHRGDQEPLASPVDEELKARLRSLGYVK
jgi:hypothetical protein